MTLKLRPYWKFLYGPVPSRRLGFSLGIDIVPYKVCSYDCIYCQLGRTTRMSLTPEFMAQTRNVMDELKAWFELNGQADVLTFAGSGEPALNAKLGEMIRAAKKLSSIPVAVITNGSLLHNPKVLEAVSAADILLPSLDAGREQTFMAINRPVAGISFPKMLEGLIAAGRKDSCRMWLEVMLVKGINDSAAELRALRDKITLIHPERIHLNTVVRPPASGHAEPVTPEVLRQAKHILGAQAEIIAEFHAPQPIPASAGCQETLLQLLLRRPCSLEDIASATARHRQEIIKILHHLMAVGQVKQVMQNAKPYYMPVNTAKNFKEETYNV